jgi:YebC/PmpR family DNA-binding regulatory protein
MGRAHEVRKVAMAKTAAKKTKLYSRYGKEIYLAAKAGGTELDGNLALRRLVEKAKKEQVPGDVIKRAIDKVKSGATENYEPVQYEGFGPGNCTVIVKCLTDNVNRTLSQVRPAFTKSKAKLGAEGSVSYLYDVESTVVFGGMDEEAVLEALVMGEVDAKDIETLDDGRIQIIGEPTDLYKIKSAIEAAKEDVEFDIDEITTTPQETVELEGEDMMLFERLMNLLNDCDDVDQIFHNVSNYDDGEEE